MLLTAILLLPNRSSGVEILEADPDLSARISGDRQVDAQFGVSSFHGLHPGTYMLGTFYEPNSREASTVLGFRVTESFLREWEKQGKAQLLFSFIELKTGDPRKICPIHIELLEPNHASAITTAYRSKQPRPRLGTITHNDLKEDLLYSFTLTYQQNLNPGDTLWIGFDSTNPLDDKDHNLIISGDLYMHPGGAPPILVTGSPEAISDTVHGMSLLQSLNRRFSSPENIEEIDESQPNIPQWVNPFRTAKKLKTLEEFRMTLRQQLSTLPNRPLIIQDQFKGFHSSIKTTNETWTLRFLLKNKDSSIALYPAVQWNGKEPEVYAFPKRFIITALPASGADPVIVADWSKSDFPHPGLMPVIFPFPWDNYGGVHLTVIEGVPMPGGRGFALSEVAFAQIDDTEPVNLRTEPENSMELPPYWSVEYATDGKTPFGNPSTPADSTNETFRVVLQETDVPRIIIRQTNPTTWERLEFYPTTTANGLPPNGFPQNIRIEFSNQDDFSELVIPPLSSGAITLSTADRPYVYPFPPTKARCVRLTLSPPRTGSMLQLEEITVNGGFPLTERRKGLEVELQGVHTPTSPVALYDRIVNGQPFQIPLLQRINLMRRDVLEGELTRVEHTMQLITRTHHRTIALLKAIGVMLAATLFAGITLHQRRQSRKGQQRIRHRIQQDLHDEIGSKLSAISMITNFNKNIPDLKPALREELTKANRCARTAIASLAEVIWLTDKEILTLDQCFEVMRNRAENMVHTMELEIDFPKNVPPLQLSYQIKRNLILLFTEMLNNATKHSEANKIMIHAEISEKRKLILSVSDDGKGFSKESASSGMGMSSMRERAQKLGGKLSIESAPGQGTTVCFTGKL